MTTVDKNNNDNGNNTSNNSNRLQQWQQQWHFVAMATEWHFIAIAVTMTVAMIEATTTLMALDNRNGNGNEDDNSNNNKNEPQQQLQRQQHAGPVQNNAIRRTGGNDNLEQTSRNRWLGNHTHADTHIKSLSTRATLDSNFYTSQHAWLVIRCIRWYVAFVSFFLLIEKISHIKWSNECRCSMKYHFFSTEGKLWPTVVKMRLSEKLNDTGWYRMILDDTGWYWMILKKKTEVKKEHYCSRV